MRLKDNYDLENGQIELNKILEGKKRESPLEKYRAPKN